MGKENSTDDRFLLSDNMARREKWRGEYKRSTDDSLKRVEWMFPEPLYESAPIQEDRLCLVCGSNPAHSVLRTPTKPDAIVPLCKDCSVDWNFYGYDIFKKINGRGTTVLVVTHDQDLTKAARRRVLRLEHRRFCNEAPE